MNNSYFLVVLKPDAVRRKLVGTILKKFEKRDFNIVSIRQIDMPDYSLVSEMYASHKSNSYFNDLLDFMTSGPIVMMILSGDLKISRDIVSDIRGEYSSSILYNLIHCSHDKAESVREVGLWFPYFDLKIHV